ncbi:MAG: GGDEF domain-containing protein, partial [Lachnospiraceae bacterium]|nr:GGDEF domain-containing protein [Lachnospiraceae bacterium]
RNVQILQWILPGLSGLLLLLDITAYIPGLGESSNREVYGIFLLLMAFLYLLYRVYFKKHPKYILALSHMFMFTAYSFGIVQATALGQDTSSAAFCMFLVAVPMLVVDVPKRIVAFTLFSEVLMLVTYFVVGNKLGDRFVVVNSISCTILGLFCGHSIQRTKLRDIRNYIMLEKQRDTDILTGAGSRAAYIRDIELLKENSDTAGVVFADVNGLKQSNDLYGHEAGDTLIINAYSLLKHYFRDDGDRIYRIGGDEFVILSLETDKASFTDKYEAMAQVDINHEIISCGYYWRDESIHTDSAVKEAEQMMYTSKSKYYETHPDLDRRIRK